MEAVLTHAHADHTYRGNQDYLVPAEGERLSRIRLGDEATFRRKNTVKLLHPIFFCGSVNGRTIPPD